MLRRVALVRTDVSEERRASIIRVTRIDELGTTLAVTSNRRTLYIYLKYIVILCSFRRFLVMANVPYSPILVTQRRHVPPKRRFSQEPSGFTFKKAAFLFVFSSYSESRTTDQVHTPSRAVGITAFSFPLYFC
jgi:hypothetical protein